MRKYAAAFILILPLLAAVFSRANAIDECCGCDCSYPDLLRLAKQGDVKAQCDLGVICLWNPSCPNDQTEGIKWIRKAAEQGYVGAQRELAFAYRAGNGVPQDMAAAAKWERKAAEQGDPNAQVTLAVYYRAGLGVTQHYGEAAKWYRKAAEQGNASGQWGLGSRYASGQGVPRDYIHAHMWFNLAQSKLTLSSTDSIIRQLIREEQDRVESKMTPAEIAEAQRLAREWKPKKEK